MKRYRLYIDESGDHTFGDLDEPAQRYLCLLGMFVEVESYRRTFHPDLEELKQKHFPHSPDEPIILHRKELVNRRGPFGRLTDPDKARRFDTNLLEFFAQQDYKLIGVTIDKKAHIERYGDAAYHPYHYCLGALLERFCGFLNFYNAAGDVLAESRGGREDTQLKQAYKELLARGTLWREATFFQKPLTSHEIKLKPKSANIAGLQVADLLAYPVKQDILTRWNRISAPEGTFSNDVLLAIKSKYNRQIYQNRINGYGRVFLA